MVIEALQTTLGSRGTPPTCQLRDAQHRGLPHEDLAQGSPGAGGTGELP
jgi:hypothetical protein